MPKQQSGERIKSNAEHVDIAPTILDLLNINIPKWMEGESLTEAMNNNKMTKIPKYSMNYDPVTVSKQYPKGSIAVIKGDYKYIFQNDSNRAELYNLKNDHSEEVNIIKTERRIADELKQLVAKKIDMMR